MSARLSSPKSRAGQPLELRARDAAHQAFRHGAERVLIVYERGDRTGQTSARLSVEDAAGEPHTLQVLR